MPVDPGQRTIEASAPGYQTWTGTIEIGAGGDSKSIGIPLLEKGADPIPEGGPAPKTPDATASTGGGSTRTLGFIVGGAGVAALGVGAVFGLLASSQASSAEDDGA